VPAIGDGAGFAGEKLFSLPGVDYIRIYEYYADKMGCPGIFV
jgi:hypothetical protein